MSWAKIDDGLHANEKFANISLAATGLWTLCLSWTCHQLKDGFVPAGIVKRFAGADSPAATELVEAGLWEEVSGGYQFHDYLQYNPSAEKIIAEREAARDRMSRRRSDANPNGSECSGDVRPNFARSSPPPVPDPVPEYITTPPDDDDTARAKPQAQQQGVGRRRRGDPKRAAGRVNPTALAEALLREADADPTRQHWRTAMAHLEAQAEPASPGAWRLKVLRNWIDGDGAPPPPGAGTSPPGREAPPPRRHLTAIDRRVADAEARSQARLAARLERVAQGLPPDDPPLSILSLPVPSAARMLEA